ncbi:hypothetical protein SLA2020_446630 [Shorea laevis]
MAKMTVDQPDLTVTLLEYWTLGVLTELTVSLLCFFCFTKSLILYIFLSQFYNFISESKSILKRKSILNFRLLSSELLSKIQEQDSYVSNTLYP